MIAARLMIRLYRFLSALYPREFREEFVAEMRSVFAALVVEAARQNPRALVAVCLRELRGLLVGLLKQHIQHWRWAMSRQNLKMVGILMIGTIVPTGLTMLLTGEYGWLKLVAWAIFFAGINAPFVFTKNATMKQCTAWLLRSRK